jgi:hypothetical protein
MEQVEGGDLIVNRGEESRLKDSADSARDLNTVDGYEAALKLAQVIQRQYFLSSCLLNYLQGQLGRSCQE